MPTKTAILNPPRPGIQSVAFVSLGCPKNLVDSEKMLGLLAEDGIAITADHDEADAIIINTCGFLEASKTESIDVIREAIESKARRPIRRPQKARHRRRLSGPASQSAAPQRSPRRRCSCRRLRSRKHRQSRARKSVRAISPKPAKTWAIITPSRASSASRARRTSARATGFRPRAPSPHAAPLRLPSHLRRVQPGLHILHDPFASAAACDPNRSATF